jgi:hypothetical protein
VALCDRRTWPWPERWCHCQLARVHGRFSPCAARPGKRSPSGVDRQLAGWPDRLEKRDGPAGWTVGRAWKNKRRIEWAIGENRKNSAEPDLNFQMFFLFFLI